MKRRSFAMHGGPRTFSAGEAGRGKAFLFTEVGTECRVQKLFRRSGAPHSPVVPIRSFLLLLDKANGLDGV